MDILPKAVTRLIESFEKLPGIGPKSATRLAFYLLHVPQGELDNFARAVTNIKNETVICSTCKNVATNDPCSVCSDSRRDHGLICVVEHITDVLSIERTGKFNGVYHVLHGSIDPLNNIGPDEIYIADLIPRLTDSTRHVHEVILAMNPNMEGEATTMYIMRLINDKKSDGSIPTTTKITRLAHGLPVGGDLEYTDEVTVTRALEGRREQ